VLERALREAHRLVVEPALLEVCQRRRRGSEGRAPLHALQEVLGEIDGQGAVEVLGVFRGVAGLRLKRSRDRRVYASRSGSRSAP